MEHSIFTISIHLYSVRDILQIRFAESFKKWRQRNLYTTLSLSTMGKTLITATFTHYAHDTNYISGLPP